MQILDPGSCSGGGRAGAVRHGQRKAEGRDVKRRVEFHKVGGKRSPNPATGAVSGRATI